MARPQNAASRARDNAPDNGNVPADPTDLSGGSWLGADDPGWTLTARAFRAAVECGRLDLPLPGSGQTWERWMAFADLAEEELSLARLAEGHADAMAILAELGGPPPPGSLWGVWAANPPGPSLEAVRTSTGWRLRGAKQYCSGARTCTHAVVTAAAPDGARLFAVSTEALRPRPGTWPAVGMAASDTLDVGFSDVQAEPLGAPGAYTSRPGFSHGGIGVAACWYGGARAVGRSLLTAAAKRDVGPHALAHLGAVDIALGTARTALRQAADEIDADPRDLSKAGPGRALRVRAIAESAAADVLGRVGRALGAGPLCHDEAHSRTVADLTVYLRQHHAERDLAALGALAAERGTEW
jgi:alkylation response protein AidB-like acyl-CoA dehydrogenase